MGLFGMAIEGRISKVEICVWLGWKEVWKGGKENGKENVIFHCLARMKMKRKENEGGEVLHPSPPFLLFPFQIWKKMGKKVAFMRRKLQITLHFSIPTYNKGITIIYYSSFHLFILYTKHTWWKPQIFLFPHFSILPTKHPFGISVVRRVLAIEF